MSNDVVLMAMNGQFGLGLYCYDAVTGLSRAYSAPRAAFDNNDQLVPVGDDTVFYLPRDATVAPQRINLRTFAFTPAVFAGVFGNYNGVYRVINNAQVAPFGAGKRLYVGGWLSGTSTTTTYVYDLTTGALVTSFAGRFLAVSNDGSYMLVSDNASPYNVRVYETTSFTLLTNLSPLPAGGAYSIPNASFSPDGTQFVVRVKTTITSHTLYFFDAVTRAAQGNVTFTPMPGQVFSDRSMAYSPDSTRLAVATTSSSIGNYVHLINTATRAVVTSTNAGFTGSNQDNYNDHIRYSPDGARIFHVGRALDATTLAYSQFFADTTYPGAGFDSISQQWSTVSVRLPPEGPVPPFWTNFRQSFETI